MTFNFFVFKYDVKIRIGLTDIFLLILSGLLWMWPFILIWNDLFVRLFNAHKLSLLDAWWLVLILLTLREKGKINLFSITWTTEEIIEG